MNAEAILYVTIRSDIGQKISCCGKCVNLVGLYVVLRKKLWNEFMKFKRCLELSQDFECIKQCKIVQLEQLNI
jgi:hypothetical protein